MKFPNSILLASLSIIAISLSSVSAQAYPDLGSAANFVSNLTFGGSGCPFLDHDYPTYDMSSVRYWKLRYPQLSDIKAGPNESIASSRRFCQASINVSVPDGWKFALSKFAHNGFAKLETGTYVKQRVVAYYSGEADQSNSSVQFNPPINHTVSAILQDRCRRRVMSRLLIWFGKNVMMVAAVNKRNLTFYPSFKHRLLVTTCTTSSFFRDIVRLYRQAFQENPTPPPPLPPGTKPPPRIKACSLHLLNQELKLSRGTVYCSHGRLVEHLLGFNQWKSAEFLFERRLLNNSRVDIYLLTLLLVRFSQKLDWQGWSLSLKLLREASLAKPSEASFYQKFIYQISSSAQPEDFGPLMNTMFQEMHKDQLSFSSKEYVDIITQLLRQDAVNLAMALLDRLPLILPVSLHDEALEVLIRKGNLIDALKWHELTFSRLREPVSIGTFNRLLKLLTKKTPSKNLDSVYSLYQVLRTSPLIKFDSVTLSILAHACCEQSRDDLLYRLFKEFEERKEELTIEFYNGIIAALLGPKRREVTAARQILKTIYEKFGGPNLRTINTLMNLYARRGHPSGAISLLLQAKKMTSQLQRKEAGKLGDLDYTIRILMYANARAGNTHNVQHLFDHLRTRDLHDLSAFNILIYSYARSGRIKAMMETWRELNKGFSGDIYTYTPMFKALSRLVEKDSSDSLAWTKEVWLYMMEQKAPLTSRNCQAALQVFQRLGEREWEGRVVRDVQQYLSSCSNSEEGRTEEEEVKRNEELINWLLMFL